MKHSEFKRKVEDLGFEVIDISKHHGVANEDGDFAWVSKNYESVLDNDYENSHKTSPEVRAKLLEILFEYARTPIQERKDEKRYSIHPFWTSNRKLVRYDYTFSNFGYEDDDSFGLGDSELYSEGKTRVFNEPEAIEICDFFGWDFDKVAVEVDS